MNTNTSNSVLYLYLGIGFLVVSLIGFMYSFTISEYSFLKWTSLCFFILALFFFNVFINKRNTIINEGNTATNRIQIDIFKYTPKFFNLFSIYFQSILKYFLPILLIFFALIITWLFVLDPYLYKNPKGGTSVINTEIVVYALLASGALLYLGIFLSYFVSGKSQSWKPIFGKLNENHLEIDEFVTSSDCKKVVHYYTESVRSRFYDEVKQLLKDAHNAQLAAYLSFTVGFAVFCVLLYNETSITATDNTTITIIRLIFPKTALIVATSLIIRTFINQYRHNILTVKYIQNELNNIEQKLVFYSLMEEELKEIDITELVKGLVSIERNFILQQGQNTVSTKLQSIIQKDEKENPSFLLDKLVDLVKAIKES